MPRLPAHDQKLGKRHGTDLYPAPEGTNPAETFISDFYLQNREIIAICGLGREEGGGRKYLKSIIFKEFASQ